MFCIKNTIQVFYNINKTAIIPYINNEGVGGSQELSDFDIKSLINRFNSEKSLNLSKVDLSRLEFATLQSNSIRSYLGKIIDKFIDIVTSTTRYKESMLDLPNGVEVNDPATLRGEEFLDNLEHFLEQLDIIDIMCLTYEISNKLHPLSPNSEIELDFNSVLDKFKIGLAMNNKFGSCRKISPNYKDCDPWFFQVNNLSVYFLFVKI